MQALHFKSWFQSERFHGLHISIHAACLDPKLQLNSSERIITTEVVFFDRNNPNSGFVVRLEDTPLLLCSDDFFKHLFQRGKKPPVHARVIMIQLYSSKRTS
jgi:hypothetical protein